MVDRGPVDWHGEYSVHLQLRIEDGNTIVGEYTYWMDRMNPKAAKVQTPKATLQVRGEFNEDRFLKLGLESTNPEYVHFGDVELELSASKQALRGVWMGFGLHANEFVGGTVVLDRV